MINGIKIFSPEVLLAAAAFFPLAAAAAFCVRGWRPALAALSPWTALPAILAVILIQPPHSARMSWLLLDARLGISTVSQVFLFFTAIVWLTAGIYAFFYLKNDKKISRFFVSYLLAMSGNLGLIIAQDAVSFYCFFALMSFASYGLVVHSGTQSAREAGKVYIILVVVGEILVFTALAFAVYAGGSIYFTDLPAKIAAAPGRNMIIGLALLGFGIKAGALPLHVWLPLAHPVAPTPASAVLSACMIKAGLLGWLNLLPFGEASFAGWGMTVLIFGFMAAFYGVIVGLAQDQPKTILAYSSISQMGMITVAVGAGLMSPALWPLCQTAIMVYATHHAFAKGALFLGVSAAGGGQNFLRKTVVAAALVLPALSLAGAPLTSGFLAKHSSKYILKKVVHDFQWNEGILFLFALSAAGTMLLLARFLWRLRISVTRDGLRPAAAGIMVPWLTLAAFSALIPFHSVFWEPAMGEKAARAKMVLIDGSALWPLIAGVTLFFLVIKAGWRVPLRIPAGDILVFYLHGIQRAKSIARALMRRIDGVLENSEQFLAARLRPSESSMALFWKEIEEADKYLGAWKVFGAGFLILLISFFVLLA